MTGGAYAASRYVITSTKQIKSSVLKSLKGLTERPERKAPRPGWCGWASGPRRSRRRQRRHRALRGWKENQANPGKAGERGKHGKEGSPSAGGVLPAGKTETDAWSAHGPEKGELFVPLSLSLPVKGEGITAVHVIKQGEAPPAGCKGLGKVPGAEPGVLFVFGGEARIRYRGSRDWEHKWELLTAAWRPWCADASRHQIGRKRSGP
jgi:hypothetical protein